MFAYPDAARYRLGVNYQQLPTNRPVSHVYNPYQRDGFMNATDNYGGDPNYVGSALKPVRFHATSKTPYRDAAHESWVASAVINYSSQVTDEDFEQPRAFWDLLSKQPGQQDHFVNNLANHLRKASPKVQKPAVGM